MLLIMMDRTDPVAVLLKWSGDRFPPYSSRLMALASDSDGDSGIFVGDGFELIVCHVTAARNWHRVVRGLLTIGKLRGFWGYLGQYLKDVKQRGLN